MIFSLYRKSCDICKRFARDFSRVETKYKRAGAQDADTARDRELLALYDKYIKKYGLEW